MRLKDYSRLAEHLNSLSPASMGEALRDLVPFVQFKKREKHPCRAPKDSFMGVFHVF